MPGINQVQVDTAHELDFARGTQTMLRLDPDYVLIGEIRDVPSAHAAISVATSGRSMMATLHSRDAGGCGPRGAGRDLAAPRLPPAATTWATAGNSTCCQKNRNNKSW